MDEAHIMPSDPTVPPTPPVPLSALLAREDLGLRQIAGPSDPETAVHWAHASEMADPYPYLLGGELLLTAGVHIPKDVHRRTHFDAYVSRIVAAGGAALGFGLAPVHDTVPGGLVAACEAHGLPLLEVPPGTTFSGVARAVWQLMERARTAELRRVTEAQQSLAAAASRPDPVPSVLRQLARRVGGRAVLYGPEGGEIAAAGRAPLDEVVRGPLAELAGVVTARASRSATDTVPGAHLSVYALGAARGFVLGVATPRRAAGDHTIASVAAVLLSLLTGEQQSGSGAARSSALVRLLLGSAPEEVAQLLGEGERWTVVHARPDTRPADPLTASALGAALGSPLVDVAEDVVRVLVPGDREPAPSPGWTLGVSAPVAPADWPAGDAQAARALARARATRVPLVRDGARPGLAELVPADAAEAHARALLAPLAATPALTDTLRAWLSLHGGWDRTAVALGVHRNTVRQRIARCAALLGTDLDDPDVRMELWFALREPPRETPEKRT
ncbi:PucR family transcriptional regulator ligand-binding domain-containing protein [Streptomyces sp. NPDC018693]|uniref:PucR family transcriptional regulator n=1 Tax=unclassified Streptomyces TaxID=2593676 RepID=UPI0037A8F9BA